jgi:outer membrane protein OmpA-like peptidoglycan-associated protein
MKRIPLVIGLIAAAQIAFSVQMRPDASPNRWIVLLTSEARRAAEIVAERNAEIELAIATYETRRTAEFAAARNAEIELAMSAYETRRMAEFAAARNAEIELAMSAFETRRTAEFAAARDAKIALAMSAYEARRAAEFAAARNAEIELAVAAYETRRTREFAAERNAEIETAIAAYETRRTREFVAMRNAEIALATAAYQSRQSSIVTGAIDQAPRTAAAPARTLGAQACLAMADAVGAVNFARSTADLDAASKPALDKLAGIAKTCVSLQIVIHGFTDASGSAQANRRLSERRAQSVATYLIGAGVDSRRLEPIGHGAAAPIAPNDSPESRALNRRIEFTLEDGAIGPAPSAMEARLHRAALLLSERLKDRAGPNVD